MKTFIALSLAVFILGSCKKNHTCYCTQDGFPDKTVTIRDTKKKAKIKCDNETTITDNSYPPEPTVIGHYNCRLK
jgi:hypothetical protein